MSSASASIGHKKVMASSFISFVAGCIICIKAKQFETVLIGQTLLGMAGAAQGIAQAAVRTLIDDPSNRLHVLSVIKGLEPVYVIVAPLVGSILPSFFGWRSIYCFLLCFAFSSFMLYFLMFPE